MTELIFTTTGSWNDLHGFGCASLGLAGQCDNATEGVSVWPFALQGYILTGSYTDILKEIAVVADTAFAAIVLFGNAGGENQFLRDIQKFLHCPIVGGGAAIDPATNRSALITGNGEAAVFLITDDRFTYTAETQCIHSHILGTCSLTLEDPRTIRTIDGRDPVQFLADLKRSLNISADDFEHLTLSDERNINAHLSLSGGKIKSGRDLQETMLLRYVPHKAVYDAMQDFYDDPEAIVFGCAGLSGLLDKPLATKSLGLFLFGEVCYVDGVADFGNLMLSKLRIVQK